MTSAWAKISRNPPAILLILLVAVLLIGWLMATPDGLLGKLDAVGYAVCHQILERTIFLGGRPLPLCARCSGIYLGAVLGMAYLGARKGRSAGLPTRPVLLILAGFLLVFAVDGLNSYLQLFPVAPQLYEPRNWLRLATGLGVGIGAALILLPAFNMTVWQRSGKPLNPSGLRDLGLLLLLGLILALLLISGSPALLYPLALLSAAGVMLMLTMVYSLIWIVLARAENRAQEWLDLALPLLGGFGAALLQIALIDLARFWLTGTWEGFHF